MSWDIVVQDCSPSYVGAKLMGVRPAQALEAEVRVKVKSESGQG